MIVCPNCNHPNPDGAVQCEACYTPLPSTEACPNCGTTVQTDALFCGQCGFNLKAAQPLPGAAPPLPPLPDLGSVPQPALDLPAEPILPPAPLPMMEPAAARATEGSQTQLQQISARLLHVQTNTQIELPLHLSVIHIGKPNDRIPPDVDVSGFPSSDIVSRIHADIRLEGDAYFIEDVGSANGTYINHQSLLPGNRHRLRSGDRISLGKGDLVTFLFQAS